MLGAGLVALVAFAPFRESTGRVHVDGAPGSGTTDAVDGGEGSAIAPSPGGDAAATDTTGGGRAVGGGPGLGRRG